MDITKMQSIKDASQRGDPSVIYYGFESPFNAPIIGFKKSADICDALVAIWKTKEEVILRAYIGRKEIQTDTKHDIAGVYIMNTMNNACEVMVMFKTESPIFLPNEHQDEYFFLFAQSQGHSQLCLYDGSIGGSALSVLATQRNVGLHLASIASQYLAPFLKGNEEVLSKFPSLEDDSDGKA